MEIVLLLLSTQGLSRDFYSEGALLPAEVAGACHGWRSKSVAKLSLLSGNTLIMATFFGEVLSAYSRAVEEEEDDEDLEENEEDEQIRRELEEKR